MSEVGERGRGGRVTRETAGSMMTSEAPGEGEAGAAVEAVMGAAEAAMAVEGDMVGAAEATPSPLEGSTSATPRITSATKK